MPDPIGIRSAAIIAPEVREHRLLITGSDGTRFTTIGYTLDDAIIEGVRFASNASIHWWSSDWGAEWQPQVSLARDGVDLVTTSGRSSKGAHPFAIVSDAQQTLIIAVAWSGNWRLAARVRPDGTLVVTAGLDHPIRHAVPAGASVEAPRVLLSSGHDWNDASRNLVMAVRATTPTTHSIRTEWNHWWPYEDAGIDANTFLTNAAAAHRAGLDVAVLDAGWFGRPGSHWFELRGDWQQENEERFPGGIVALADRTRALGIDFGLWMEPEAIGSEALVNRTHQAVIARDAGGESLGYVCLGSPEGRMFVLASVRQALRSTRASWLKWDFNLDPGAGCARTDHGHTSSDGLFTHVRGLYDVLDAVRAEFPGTVLENCSSGGLRWDLGIAAHVDTGFATDPDWPEHALACRWASSLFFPPERQLGWCDSEWRGSHPHQHVRAADGIPPHVLDRIVVVSMLGGLGVSQRLVDWPTADLERLHTLVTRYDEHIRPHLADAILERLTGQPLREGSGERRVAFLLRSAQGPAWLFCCNLTDEPWDAAFHLGDVTRAEDLLANATATCADGEVCLRLTAQGCAVVEIQ